MEAVEDKVGGNNCALSQKIAKEHPAGPVHIEGLV